MKIPFRNPNKKPSMLKVTVEVPKTTLIGIVVCDSRYPKTIYSQSQTECQKGIRTINVRLPLCPATGFIIIYNCSDKANRFSGFKLVKLNKDRLTTNLNVYDSTNPIILDFVKFAQDFSERASYISASGNDGKSSIYMSKDGKFTIHYVDEIKDSQGRPLKSSMRVNNETGEMELSKKYVKQYTVAERMAILLHEFSHFYLNKVHKDEFEADMNALMIYCGLGYPRKEAGTAFYKVFYRTPSDINIERMKKIHSFLKNFDRTDYKILN